MKKYGSRKVSKTGNVENANNPIATVDTWIDLKNVVQWIAKTIPSTIKEK